MAALICFLLAGMILCFPGTTISASQSALSIWARDIVPSLFPYMVLCKMTAQRLRSARFPAAPLAALLGCMGGSPSGAAMLSVSSGGMAQSQLYALCALTGTISPMFFVGTLHAWGVAQKTCLCLLAAHGLGALSAFVCVRRLSPVREKVAARESPEKANGNPITDSVFSVLGVGGCIVFFSVAAACIRIPFPFLPETGCAYLQSVLEIAGGMRLLIQTSSASFARDVSMAVLTGFGGLSILTQNHLFLQAFALPRAAPGAHVWRGYGASSLAYMSHFRSASNACRSILLIWLWLTPMIFAVSFCVCSRT